MTLPRSSVASWALSALLLAALGAVGEALEASEGPLGFRLPLLPALRDAAALLSGAEAGGEHGVASVLKAHDALWPALDSSLRPLLLGAGASKPVATARRLAEDDSELGPTPLEALRAAALQARDRSGLAQLRAARQAASSLVGQLSGPLGALLGAADGGANSGGSTHRQLSEETSLPEQLQERIADLAARFSQLGAARSGLRSRLHEALDPGAGAAPARRLRQSEAAGAMEDDWWWAEEEDYSAVLYPGYSGQGLTDVLIIEDVTLAPLASDMLARMLALARNALDMAITMAAPNPADWPAAYGAALPQLLEPLPFESPSDAASEDPVDAGTQAEEAEEDLPAIHAEPADGGAAAKAQPPLPAGEPARRRRLRQSPSSQDDQYYYDESYDDVEDDYSGDEYGEAYYADLDDWLFDSALELQAVLARLTTPPAIAADGTQLPSDASQPALPVFAVFAGSSKAAGQPANGSVAAVDGQPAGPRVVELLVAPFSEAARTPVPHTETRTGLDPRYLGAAISVSCLVLLLGLLAGAWHWSRTRTRGQDADQQESLLYQHIPGTPSRARNSGAAGRMATPWAAGKADKGLAATAAAPVPKKLSNLPA